MPKIIAQKEDWIKLGYQLFSQKGISGIVIETMAKELSCNKSSFYWHFKSKKEFINDLVTYWVEIETLQIISNTEKERSIKDKVNSFLKVAFKKEPYLEFIFFLKRYAKNHSEIQQVIDDIDAKRLAYSAKLFEELGYSEEMAVIKARVFYNYLIGYHEMIKNKKQSKNYLIEVKNDLNHFLNLENI
ncbi:TetR/AcrR family transcriptional regulator [Flagellimonas pacifica]|uniref:Transcriptional regulator, TetR family n=1 Tax=Flagellimonas pacifica TaxID=1247520 RepID=A0A285MCI2_9FLAO|nr:TetR/AcrR family transcriptional regulator [Allomuricauda parva]SNY94892.1 transcriptional regulator, TetR family [Allomuricauda parva]